MMYKRIYALIPNGIKEAFVKQLGYLGIGEDVKRVLGFLFSIILTLTFATALDVYWLFGFNFGIAFVLALVAYTIIAYMLITLSADAKGKAADVVLPDALQLISSNMKAGLTTERALLVSARPEFGILEKELKKVSTKVMSGMPVEDALLEMPNKIKSKSLERTMWLLAQGISSGGQISDLLFQLSDNLRDQNTLQDEIKANVSIYVLMIFISGGLGAPILYGISSFIVDIMSSQRQIIPQISTAGLGATGVSEIVTSMLRAPASAITSTFIVEFTMIMLVVTAIFSSLVIGIISGGKEKFGIKYMPFLVVVSFILFFVVRNSLEGVFGNLL